MNLLDHLIIAPILLPLLVGAALVPVDEHRRRLKVTVGLCSTFSLLAIALVLLWQADQVAGAAPSATYLLGNWSLPFGIALAADRLAALMLLLTAVLACATLMFAAARWDRVGVHFHALFQFMLVGVNGAFLTNDLFNLFVFFEVMLAASYGLLLHGSGKQRVRTGLHYVAVNLAASSVFLIGVALIYAAAGSLNMADIALRIPPMSPADTHLLETGAAILAVAFLIKSAIWPLNFWLPGSYAAATPPVAAMFAIMTKVGIYVLLRLWLLLFSDDAGDSAGFGGEWLLYGGLATLAVASLGMLAAQDFKRLAGFSVIASSGTLLAGIAIEGVGATAAALYYMLGSTLALAAFFLLTDLLERIRDFGANLLAVTVEAFEAEGMVLPEQDEVGVAIPAALAFLGMSFVLCTLMLTGMPPLSGFIGKFALMATALAHHDMAQLAQVPVVTWLLLVLLVVSGLAGIITLMRLGIRLFWVPASHKVPRLRLIEAAPIAGLLLCCVLITVQAGPVMGFLQRTAEALHDGTTFAEGVMDSTPVAGEVH
ncbi:monovalent cation/H+ antiporter subunit D [Isoalcanivorax pacificus W11-5]|uniref:Monovalent cation/H+ antiporter subunit D n=1 Tax=Isoalcanivorax pacificus W11-5 TaxID=391936 RepID=A0A0B4XTW0_9GAMM|nr:monovalent cation/H+ antiporter subunit D [Isoalcanivorax pacificus]AJD49727.1 monovalent cation/H+ antiporter subunit D [Isoalcanivorax pacificus W11-5]